MTDDMKLTPAQVLDSIECTVADIASGLNGLSVLLRQADNYDLSCSIDAHAKWLSEILRDMELYYRPGLGLSDLQIKTGCDSELAPASHPVGEQHEQENPAHVPTD